LRAAESGSKVISLWEQAATSSNGFVYAGLGALLAVLALAAFIARPGPWWLVVAGVAAVGEFWLLGGLYMLQPNQAALLTLFGSYRGTDRVGGLRWANPFYAEAKVSVRAHNFNSEKLKVNDLRGNPIEIAAAIV
jgi:regulator of protease activity HflC (stomatin/prohibitin superfamily)